MGVSPLLKKESSPRLKTTIRPSGDRLVVAESVKFVSCVYSDGDVTGTAGFTRGNSAAARHGGLRLLHWAIRHGHPRCAWSSTSRASVVLCTRSARSLCKQWRKSSGIPRRRRGGQRLPVASVREWLLFCPVKGGRPVSVTRTQPKAQMSARVSDWQAARLLRAHVGRCA